MARSLPILAVTCLLLAGCDQDQRMEHALHRREEMLRQDIKGKVEELNTKIEERTDQVQNQLQGIGASIGQVKVEAKVEMQKLLDVTLREFEIKFAEKIELKFNAALEAKFEKLTAQLTSQIQAGLNNTSTSSTQTSNAGRDSTISYIVNFSKEQLEAMKSENRTTLGLVLGLALILTVFQERSRRRAYELFREERGKNGKGDHHAAS